MKKMVKIHVTCKTPWDLYITTDTQQYDLLVNLHYNIIRENSVFDLCYCLRLLQNSYLTLLC
jgi:hypothetical protein